MKRVLISLFLGMLALVLLAAVLGWQGYQRFLDKPMDREMAREVLLLEPGTSFAAMRQQVDPEAGAIRRWYWKLLAYQTDAGSQIKAGEYRVTLGMTPARWVDKLVRGDVIKHEFTIVEGWRFAELRSAIAKHPALRDDLGEMTGEEIMSALGRPDLHPEGRFLPETYQFTRGSSALKLLQRALTSMDEALAVVWSDRGIGLPFDSPDEALILASIIEKETAVAGERGQIAGVFVRRLRKNMRLQTDPTVIYGLGDAFDGNLRRRDLRADTPYNTYTRHGLPPTPIALPGIESLKAAVNPEPGDSLYFVARGDGSHQFSRTFAEHQKAVRRYQLN